MARKVILWILLAVVLTALGEVVILKWVAPAGDRSAIEQMPAGPLPAEPSGPGPDGP